MWLASQWCLYQRTVSAPAARCTSEKPNPTSSAFVSMRSVRAWPFATVISLPALRISSARFTNMRRSVRGTGPLAEYAPSASWRSSPRSAGQKTLTRCVDSVSSIRWRSLGPTT